MLIKKKKTKRDKELEEDIEQFKALQKEQLDLFIKKNSDYGRAYAKYGSIGVIIRGNDKVNRAMNIETSKISLVKDEKLRDTILDNSNYSLMTVMLLDREKSKAKKKVGNKKGTKKAV